MSAQVRWCVPSHHQRNLYDENAPITDSFVDFGASYFSYLNTAHSGRSRAYAAQMKNGVRHTQKVEFHGRQLRQPFSNLSIAFSESSPSALIYYPCEPDYKESSKL